TCIEQRRKRPEIRRHADDVGVETLDVLRYVLGAAAQPVEDLHLRISQLGIGRDRGVDPARGVVEGNEATVVEHVDVETENRGPASVAAHPTASLRVVRTVREEHGGRASEAARDW